MTTVNAGAETCHWGVFDANLVPVVTIDSGAEVTIHTVSGGPEVLPGEGSHAPSDRPFTYRRKNGRIMPTVSRIR